MMLKPVAKLKLEAARMKLELEAQLEATRMKLELKAPKA
jgi:hypothetical protein